MRLLGIRQPLKCGFALRHAALLWTFLLCHPAPGSAAEQPNAPAATSLASTESSPRTRFRILDLENSARFNYVDQTGMGVLDRGIQYRLRMRSRLNLRADGMTYILTRAETGRGFDNSWNETAQEIHPGQTIFNVKSVSLVQQAGSHALLAFGGLDFEHGAGSDETYVSHDGYMTGYRAQFRALLPWLPNRVSVTAAHVGDFTRPNMFSRLRFDRANYIQAMAQHDLTDNLTASTELDALGGKLFNRNAVRLRHAGPFEDAVAEVVVRGSDRFTFAWSSELSRRWDSKTRSTLIYSDLPARMYLVNGLPGLKNRGEIGVGKRLAIDLTRNVTNDCAIHVFAGRLLDNTPSARWVAQVGLSYQFAPALNRLLR